MHEEKEPFQIQKRRGLVVWVYSLRQLKNLRRFGFVRQVEPSYRPDVAMDFADKIGTDEAYPSKEDGFDVEETNTMIRLAEHV